MEATPKNEDYLKNEDDPKNKDNLKNEEYLMNDSFVVFPLLQECIIICALQYSGVQCSHRVW